MCTQWCNFHNRRTFDRTNKTPIKARPHILWAIHTFLWLFPYTKPMSQYTMKIHFVCTNVWTSYDRMTEYTELKTMVVWIGMWKWPLFFFVVSFWYNQLCYCLGSIDIVERVFASSESDDGWIQLSKTKIFHLLWPWEWCKICASSHIYLIICEWRRNCFTLARHRYCITISCFLLVCLQDDMTRHVCGKWEIFNKGVHWLFLILKNLIFFLFRWILLNFFLFVVKIFLVLWQNFSMNIFLMVIFSTKIFSKFSIRKFRRKIDQ